tara:strand:+ start:600 stop:1031 length:432 start_codon:yes stop_codon:yes gene_type:complete
MTEPTVFGAQATEQIVKTVREVSRRMMNELPNRARWQHQAGGNGDKSIWGTVDEVYCDPYGDPLLMYCWVTVTDYGGGCTAPIPGDDGTGAVQVFQKCDIFTAYYTAADLVGKTIEAGYYYPRTGTCTPRFLVRQVCGTPECA